MLKSFKSVAALAAISLWGTPALASDILNVDVFNPGAQSLFPVSSTLVSGPTEAILFDAQFQKNDAETLVKKIKESGKTLKAIYITHGDPDFYFGLDTIKAANPDVKIYASPKTLEKIKASSAGKLGFWGPKLGKNAPKTIIMPDVLKGDTLSIDGQAVKVMGLNGDEPKRTFVWIPSNKTVIASISVFENQHVWIADTQTPDSRQKWMKTLDAIEALQPAMIIPGHYLGSSKFNLESVNFTKKYVKDFEDAAAKSKTSTELMSQMTKQYPNFANTDTLGLSAKVIMGEMKWGS